MSAVLETPRRRALEGGLAVVFAGGGTGGHLAPALALAERVASDEPRGRALFLSTDREAERSMIDSAGFERRALAVRPFSARPRAVLGFAAGLVRSVFQARRAIRDFAADVVVGLGGYGSVPGVLAGRAAGLPVVLLEQNTIPGRANRLLAPLASEIHCQWPGAARLWPERARVLGSPVRARIRPGSAAEARRSLGLAPDLPTLLVVGGSQGARALNDIVLAALDRIEERAGRLQIAHITGERDASMKGAYSGRSLSHFCAPFLHDIERAYQAADLVLGRAGATTIVEIAEIGLPAVLVPYPHAADDHQRHNARAYAESGAAVVAEERELSAGSLVDLLDELLLDPARLEAMSLAARSFFPAGAAEASARRLGELARRRRA